MFGSMLTQAIMAITVYIICTCQTKQVIITLLVEIGVGDILLIAAATTLLVLGLEALGLAALLLAFSLLTLLLMLRWLALASSLMICLCAG